jgi:alpha-1,3-rhamnosyltransferase
MITIFIPSFNHSNYVIESIERARQIAVDNKKIFLVDDASVDDSVEKIERYIAENNLYDEIIFVKNENNKGVVYSLNLCLSQCNTEYMYLMASDDIPVSDGIEALFDTMERCKNIKFLVGGGVNLFVDGSETPIYDWRHREFFNLPHKQRNIKLFLDCPSPILSQTTLIRVSALKFIGGWDPEILADDYVMFMKLLTAFPEKGTDFDFFPDIVCVKYRHHGENSYQRLFRQYLMTVQVLERFAPSNLVKSAIGYKFGYYFLYAISKSQYKVCFKLLLNTNLKYWGWGFIGILQTVYHRVIS